MVQIAVDVGGTFTDVVCLDESRQLSVAKVPTTHGNIVDGILEGARQVLGLAKRAPADVGSFIHSTTIATNAILEHKGARTALLATEGFEDVLEIGRQKRSQMYDLDIDAETPVFLAPGRLRAGIRERVDSDGSTLEPLDEEQVVAVVRDLRECAGVTSVAVSYLFSFANPAHERRTRELIHQHFPDLSVSISSDVDPVFREYERTCLTCFDAYVRPNVATYIGNLSKALHGAGIKASLRVMQSRGGITSAEVASEKPVTMLLSGPAAGVVGAKYVGALSSYRNLVTVDIGGTSCDVALVKEGAPLISREGRIGKYPLRMSMVDVQTVGAGGGSLVWRDEAGGLHVGPESAGSNPGPICYGRGGEVPTVTDASLVLGYLNGRYFAGGQLSLDAEAARAGVERIAREFDVSAEVMAAGIHRIINERMANEIRLVSVKRGHDPRQFALAALGGAGPVHGGRLAASLSIPTMVIPHAPGVVAAFGLLVSNIEHEITRTVGARIREVDPEALNTLFGEMDEMCAAKIARESIDAESAAIVKHYVDVRYAGQSFELEIPIGLNVTRGILQAAESDFHAKHHMIFGYARPDSPTEVINVRTVHTIGAESDPILPMLDRSGSLAKALKDQRLAFFEEIGHFTEVPVYERWHLPLEQPIHGPAIIEQPDTTTVLYPGHIGSVDEAGNLIVHIGSGS